MPMYQDAAQLWSDDSLRGCLVTLEKEPTEKGDDDDSDGGGDGNTMMVMVMVITMVMVREKSVVGVSPLVCPTTPHCSVLTSSLN